MAQSLNSKVDLTVKASCHNGLGSTGHVMVGDQAFEYYNVRNVEDYVQIPWDEVDYISASVLFKSGSVVLQSSLNVMVTTLLVPAIIKRS